MSRKFIPCFGLVLGAAMMAWAPALATSTVAGSVLQQPTMSGLADRVEQAWAERADLEDADIDARVDGSRLILEGHVGTTAQRQAAERVAKRVKGVPAVDNQITVRTATGREGTQGSVLAGDVKDTAKVVANKTETAAEKTGSAISRAAEATRDAVVTGAVKTRDAVAGAPERLDETWITSKIAAKINADDALENVDVDVKVDKNVVTITGDVPSTTLRDRVLRIARDTEGVASVIDRMAVRTGAPR